MLRRLSSMIVICSFVFAGCKTAGNSLPAQAAASALTATYFSTNNSVQTLSFTAGGEQTPKPYALEGFLYAKRWLTCQASEPGPFSRSALCRFDSAGRTYARENGWKAEPSIGSCAQCETWTVPLARATLERVTDVSLSDKAHAVVTYGYDVIPNEIGFQLAAWMRQNPVAWCGPDPRAIGAWSHPRTATATFVKAPAGWEVASSPAAFAATFQAVDANAASRACS